MNAADLKLHLLLEGLNINHASLEGASFKSDKYLHNNRHIVPIEKREYVPQELLLRHDEDTVLCVGVLTRPSSPFILRCNREVPYLSLHGKIIDVEVDFVPEPNFWRMYTRDGVPNYLLLSVPGLNELNLWTWHDCALHYQHQGCAFCTTTSTSIYAGTGPKSRLLSAYKIHRLSIFEDVFRDLYPVLIDRSVDSIRAALKYDFANTHYWFTVISGNLSNEYLSKQHDFMSRFLADILEYVPELDRENIVLNIMPPNNEEKIVKIHEAGAKYYMANLEIWDDNHLRKLCPGKYSFGRVRFIQMLEYAVGIFGSGKVWCNFVCGLEPPKLQLEGYEILAKKGIVSGANIFHKDPKVRANATEDFNFGTLKRYYLEAAEILHKHGLTPFYCMESRRSSLLWEAYLGLL